ncbi:TetR family transcriptional regulator [Streptomyces sp. B6B3]|uniref:TetR/AcrR family transcriptional regulator n=1 Tax=Streptomyces sp. B6B3 TaxID=3153570 RepID=UPI00325EAEC7
MPSSSPSTPSTPSTASTASTSRADRRRATEARVLECARRLFAERGFERTTIRAVASLAEVDPALVMQYFGSKRNLFTRSLEAAAVLPKATDADGLVDELLATLVLKLGGLPESTIATLRSMLTDPEAAEHARRTLGQQIESISAILTAHTAQAAHEDAELRAALITTIVVGVAIGHQLLGLAPLRDAPTDRIAALLRPALAALTESPH